MTKYLRSEPFSVSAPGTKQYADNWERIFGKKRACPDCNGEGTVPVPSFGNDYEDCETCSGTGKVPDVEPEPR